jgi:GntR family transcriptional regulator
VARAYLELERAGVVVKRHGSGTFVADSPPQVTKSQRRKILGQRADALLAEARQLGADFDEVLDLLRARHERMNPVTP